jgi:hypothetical protein
MKPSKLTSSSPHADADSALHSTVRLKSTVVVVGEQLGAKTREKDVVMGNYHLTRTSLDSPVRPH